MRPEDFGIGLVGLGGIADVHIGAYLAEGFRVVGGADPSADARAAKRERFGERVWLANAAELAALPNVDVLDITVLHSFGIREPLLRQLAQFGKPLLIQKPLATHFRDAVTLVEIAEDAGVPMMVHHQSVFVPAFARAWEIVSSGEIGNPYFCQIHDRAWWEFRDHPFFGKEPRWVLAAMAIHHLALVDHWFGPWSSVYALTAVDRGQADVVGDTLNVINVTFESGMRALIINNWSARDDGALQHPKEEVVIQGDRGTVIVQGSEIVVRTAGDERRETVQGTWFPDAFGKLMRHYLTALSSGQPFLHSARANLRVIAMMEAAYQSAESGRAIGATD